MNKESILNAAKNNKKQGYEFEERMSVKSYLYGLFFSLAVGAVLFFLEFFMKKTVNISLLAVGMTLISTQAIYEGKKNNKLSVFIIGIIEMIFAVCLTFVSIGRVVLL